MLEKRSSTLECTHWFSWFQSQVWEGMRLLFQFTTVTDLVLGSKCGSEFEIAPQYFAILVVRNKFCWFSISPCPVCEEGRSGNVSAKVEKITLNFKFNFQLRTVSGQVKHSFSIAYFQFHLKHFAKEWFNATFHWRSTFNTLAIPSQQSGNNFDIFT